MLILCLSYFITRGWCPKFATELNIIVGCSSKSIWVTRLLFCQNDSPIKEPVWSLIYFLNYSLFWYLDQSQILGITLYCKLWRIYTTHLPKKRAGNSNLSVNSTLQNVFHFDLLAGFWLAWSSGFDSWFSFNNLIRNQISIEVIGLHRSLAISLTSIGLTSLTSRGSSSLSNTTFRNWGLFLGSWSWPKNVQKIRSQQLKLE